MCWRGSLRSSARAGAVASKAATAAPINAVLRVIMKTLLRFDGESMSRLTQAFLAAKQASARKHGAAPGEQKSSLVCAGATSGDAGRTDWHHEADRAPD